MLKDLIYLEFLNSRPAIRGFPALTFAPLSVELPAMNPAEAPYVGRSFRRAQIKSGLEAVRLNSGAGN